MAEPGRTGRYLYAIGRGLAAADLAGTSGQQDAPLRLVEHRGLLAVVSEVDLEEFGEEGLRRNLEDLDWLERVARTHDAVVRAVTAAGPAAPVRLATVCFDDDQVRARIEQWHEPLVHALDRVDGRLELSVKAYAPDDVDAPTEVTAGAAAAAPEPGAGAAYLRRRKERTLRRQEAADQAARDAETLYAALAEHAVAGRRLRPQDPRLTGHEGTMTLNAAYLVEADVADDFLARVREVASGLPGLEVEANGPWPPYSFAAMDDR